VVASIRDIISVGFMAGIDIYDCVVVINDRKALEAFSKVRVSLGGEISVGAGPIGAGGVVESEVMKDRKPWWSYMKSRGLYGGVQLDGTIIEREMMRMRDSTASVYHFPKSLPAMLSRAPIESNRCKLCKV
jgi:lipid-binding SYLF domain-containing protein